jgi:hypothetical protein
MRTQDKDLLAEYGEAMLYSHLIEDLLKLILRDAVFFHVNSYTAPATPIPKLRFEDLIDEFGRAFPPPDRMVDDLHSIRKIRNKLTHAFVPQVGPDLLTEEGRDQIHAMLERFSCHAARHRKALAGTFEALVKKAVATDLPRVLDREEEAFDARVATSEIQRLLDELDGKEG